MNTNTTGGSADTPPEAPAGSANKSPRKSTPKAAESAAAPNGQQSTSASSAQVTPDDLRRAVFDFGEHVIGVLAGVQAEQQQLWAQDVLLTRELLQQQRESQEADRIIFTELARRRTEGARPQQLSETDVEQMRVALQFRALRTSLGSRDRAIGADTLPPLVDPPQIIDTRGKSSAPFILRFFADFPPKVASIRVLRTGANSTTEHPVDDVFDGQLALDSDDVRVIELVGSRGEPLAMGIPFRD